MKKYQVWCHDPIEHDDVILYETNDKADAELVLEGHRDLCDDLYSYWVEETEDAGEVPAENIDTNIVTAEESWWYTSAVRDFENDLKARNDVVVYSGENYYIAIGPNCSFCFLNNKIICAHKGNTVWDQFLWLKEVICRSKDDKRIFDDELLFYSSYLVEPRYNIDMHRVLIDLISAFNEAADDGENFDDGVVTTLRNTTEADIEMFVM